MRQLVFRLPIFAATLALIAAAGGGLAFVQQPLGATYLGLWLVWLVVTALGRRWGTGGAGPRSVPFLLFAGLAYATLALAPPWEHAHLSGPLPRGGPVPWVGIGLFAGGIALQSWAMWALHGGFRVQVGVSPGQRLVTSGPYGLVRHPGYLSYLVSIAGIALAMGSLIAFGLLVAVAVYLVRLARREEEALVAAFGEEYRSYQRRVRRLIPFIY
ncbi:MAG: isoprenylcysteine carboxylmethyltransferase family protein, partial [Anaerolineae bacterium]|nr:isoprenylcysteine carboxylmethyltransferase family protein [Anaerolineae bacterium]